MYNHAMKGIFLGLTFVLLQLANATTVSVACDGGVPIGDANYERCVVLEVTCSSTAPQLVMLEQANGVWSGALPSNVNGEGTITVKAGFRIIGKPNIFTINTVGTTFHFAQIESQGNYLSPLVQKLDTVGDIAETAGQAGDNIVEIADYTRLSLDFDKTVEANVAVIRSDLTGDGIIDIADYTALATNFDAVGQTPVEVPVSTNEVATAIQNGLFDQSGTVYTIVLPPGVLSVPQRFDFVGDPSVAVGQMAYDSTEFRLRLNPAVKVVVQGNQLNTTRIVCGLRVPVEATYSLIYDVADSQVYTQVPESQLGNIVVLDFRRLDPSIGFKCGKYGSDFWTGGWPRHLAGSTWHFWGLGNIAEEGSEARPEQPMVLSVDTQATNAAPMEMATEFNWLEPARWRRARYIPGNVSDDQKSRYLETRVPQGIIVPDLASAVDRNSVVMHLARTDSDPRIAELSQVEGIGDGSNGNPLRTKITFRERAEYLARGLAQGSRYRWINEPKFLDEPGEFYVHGNKIYMILPAGAQAINVSMPAELSNSRYLHQPGSMDYPDSPYGNIRVCHTPFLAANLAGLTLTNVHFDTGMGNAVQTEAVQKLVVSGCTFQNFGQAPIISRSGAYRMNPKFANVVLNDDGTIDSGLTKAHQTTILGCSFSNCYREAVRHEKSNVSMLQANSATCNPDLSYWYYYTSLGMSEQGTLYKPSGSTQNVLIMNNQFRDIGKLFADQHCVKISRGVNGALIKGNLFERIGGNGVAYQGTNILIGQDPGTDTYPNIEAGFSNVFDKCCYDFSDGGGVDSYRSFVDLGNVVSYNLFKNIQQYPEVSVDGESEFDPFPGGGNSGSGVPHLGPPGDGEPNTEGYKKSVGAIYWDGMLSYQTAHDNKFDNCQFAFVINGGIGNHLNHNTYVNSGFMENFREGHNPVATLTQEGWLDRYLLNNETAGAASSGANIAKPWMPISRTSGYTRLQGNDDKAQGATGGQTGLGSFYREFKPDTENIFSFYGSAGWNNLRGSAFLQSLPIRGSGFFNTSSYTFTSGNSSSTRYNFPLASGQSPDPGTEGWVDRGLLFLDRISEKDSAGNWKQGTIPVGSRVGRPPYIEYELTSQENQWFGTQADTFTVTQGQKLFFGKVQWTGSGSYTQVPFHVGQDLLLVHIPGRTFGTHATDGQPLPLQVDEQGRFGLVLPASTDHIFVKMYGTLWKKITFAGTVNTLQEQSWAGTGVDLGATLTLRYGDVNEDNVISLNPLTGDRAYLSARVGGVVSMTATGENSIYKYDYVCDLNRDNKVDGDDGDRELFDLFLQPSATEGDLAGATLP